MPDHRLHIPIGVKLKAALLLLGFSEEEINGDIHWDHHPPLALRFVDPETGQMHPHPNDPRYLRPLRTQDHRIKTSGTKATSAGSDIHAIAKAKRLRKSQEEFRARILAKDAGEPKPKSKWPKRSFKRR